MGAEKNFENKVKDYLEKMGAYVLKYWGGGVFTKSGVPDLLVCYNGHFFGIEIKAENGVVSKLQKYHINEIKKSGGTALVLRPSGFDDFKKMIEGELF